MNDWNDVFRTILGFAPTNTTVVEYKIEPRPRAAAVNMPAVKSVIFNKEATIVYFDDGTKCIVRKSAQDDYNREHAVVYAIVKRAYGIVGKDGLVEGNGMGNMLAKIVANGYDQEAHDAAEKAKRAAKRKEAKAPVTKTRFVGDNDHEKYAWGYQKPWRDVTVPNRDSKGRFVKKANCK